MDSLRFNDAASLELELSRWHHLDECLLLEMTLTQFGYGVRLTFDHIWASDGHVRQDLGQREERLVIELSAVERLLLEGDLTKAMIDHPEAINWGLSEVAGVRAQPCEAGLRLLLSWESDRKIVIDAKWADVLRPPQPSTNDEPLPFYALVRTRGPGTHLDPNRPLAVGAVLGRSEGPSGWVYAVSIGETAYSFEHHELIPLGVVLDRSAFYPDARRTSSDSGARPPADGL